MNLYLLGHDYKYAAEQVLLLHFPRERPVYPSDSPAGDRAELRLSRGPRWVTATCRLCLGGDVWKGTARVAASALTDRLITDRLCQRAVKLAFYRACVRRTGEKPPWGALTGIRPAKLLTAMLEEEGLSEPAALGAFTARYDVSRERAALCLDAARAARAAAASLESRDVCLYVGIPFCPTRCAYCSFVSHSVEKSMKLIPPFLEALEREIAATAAAVRELGLRVISLYMGGGTPTTLSAGELDRLCTVLALQFDLTSLRDYSVEAGRPDTITAEKLAVLRAHGVNRVSVNPQTMEDSVLEAIGRRHTARDVLEALDLVRETGSFTVNMDLIAGLPGDTPAGFFRTLDRVLTLGAENITIHTLSLKKGTRITLEQTRIPDAATVGEMLTGANRRLARAHYAPYYLYRQKFMSGGFENVGWALQGHNNLYNICIMEELCSILAMGGGGSTKLVDPGRGRIERLFAPKYPLEYIQSIQKVLAGKTKIKEFYDGISSARNQR